MIQIPVEPRITGYLHRKAAKLGIPLSGTFELTPVCNMNCRMCYVRMSQTEQERIQPLKTAEEWIELGRIAKENGMIYLLLTGGEPFLRKDFKEILHSLQRMGFVININTNGTLIDEKTISWLQECPPARINITLYGASDATYDKLCGNPKGFSQVTKAIDLLQQAGIPVKINMSLTPYNAADFEAMVAWTKQHQLISQVTSYMFPPIRKDLSKIGMNERFTPQEAAYYTAKTEQLLNGNEDFLRRVKNNEIYLKQENMDEDCLLIDNASSPSPIEEGLPIQCRAGKCSFWVTWEGTVLPCGMIPSTSCKNAFSDGFLESWETAKYVSSEIRLPSKCGSCNLREKCKACAAMVYAESGSFSKVPTYRCQMTKEYLNACKQIQTEISNRG